jgi:PAS domain S-box-containing protein
MATAALLAVLALVLTYGWRVQRRAARLAAAQAEALARLERELADRRAEADAERAARESAEEALRASEQRYALALRASQDGVWDWDLASDAVALSPRWKGLLGFAADELPDTRESWLARVHADDRAGFVAALDAHLADPTGTPLDHELRLVHKDGSARWVLARGVAIRHGDGTPYRMVGLDTDVTRVKRVLGVLDAVVEGTAGRSGEDFFAALVRHFARALEVDCAFVAECADDPPTRVRTLGWWSADGARESFEFALDGTPCAEVVQGGRECFHRSDVAERFPRERGVESYLGLPIVGSAGKVLGHLAFMHAAPRGDELLLPMVYRIFCARAAAEIERLQALRALQRAAPA